MFQSLNCFARLQKPSQLGGETLFLCEPAEEGRLVGDAVWDEHAGPAAGIPALDLTLAGSSVEVLDGEGVVLEMSYSFSAWLELPLEVGNQRERALAACGPRVDQGNDDDDDDDDDFGSVVAVKDGELGACREKVSGFKGCGFFVDDLEEGWYHLCCVVGADDGATKFFVNGRAVGVSAARAPPGAVLRRIGGKAPENNNLPDAVVLDESWRGRVADVRVFDRPLKGDDIAQLFSSGAFAVAAAHAPPLPPKTHRAFRAARARLRDALDTVEDANQILDAATDLIHAKCADHLDVGGLLTAVKQAKDLLIEASQDAATKHGLLQTPVLLGQQKNYNLPDVGAAVRVASSSSTTASTKQGPTEQDDLEFEEVDDDGNALEDVDLSEDKLY